MKPALPSPRSQAIDEMERELELLEALQQGALPPPPDLIETAGRLHSLYLETEQTYLSRIREDASDSRKWTAEILDSLVTEDEKIAFCKSALSDLETALEEEKKKCQAFDGDCDEAKSKGAQLQSVQVKLNASLERWIQILNSIQKSDPNLPRMRVAGAKMIHNFAKQEFRP